MKLSPRRTGLRACAIAATMAASGLAGSAAQADVPDNPVTGAGTPVVSTIWNDERYEVSTTTWTDLPGAVIPDSVGQGSANPGFDAVYVVHFDGDALCSNPSDNAACSVRVLVGDQVAFPGDSNSRFITARGHGEWSAHGYTRTACFAPAFQNRDATVKVQVKTSNAATTFGLQNWHLEVQRLPLRGNTCP